jgi:uncharacterized membrane protein (GlpM family)
MHTRTMWGLGIFWNGIAGAVLPAIVSWLGHCGDWHWPVLLCLIFPEVGIIVLYAVAGDAVRFR